MRSQIKAIVYTSNTGFTARYAALLAQAAQLPCYELKHSRELPSGTSVFYMGWLMAGQIKGLKKARKRFHLAGVCGVGMGSPDDNPPDELRQNNHLDEIPVFSLQGGYAPAQIKGVYRLMMSLAAKVMSKKAGQQGETMRKALTDGIDFVSSQNLGDITGWMQKN
ncbi:MAG: hypothetical protein H6Q60_912 [Oscillospiraceae bacterium]|nr:hypothetical protein [Oscillospiraceae bacterium]